MTVLFVDDDEAVRLTLAIALHQRGLLVETCVGGPQALGRLGGTRYDWLVTDLNMGSMDGRTLALKAQEAQPGLRCVLVSAEPGALNSAGGPFVRAFEKPLDADLLADFLLADGRD